MKNIKDPITQILDQRIKVDLNVGVIIDYILSQNNSLTLSTILTIISKEFPCPTCSDKPHLFEFNHFGSDLTMIVKGEVSSMNIGDIGEDLFKSTMVFFLYCTEADHTRIIVGARNKNVAKDIMSRMTSLYGDEMHNRKP